MSLRHPHQRFNDEESLNLRDRQPVDNMTEVDDEKVGMKESVSTKTSLGKHVYLQKFESRTISCNGDCGSRFAKLINNIIHPNVEYNQFLSFSKFENKNELKLFQ